MSEQGHDSRLRAVDIDAVLAEAGFTSCLARTWVARLTPIIERMVLDQAAEQIKALPDKHTGNVGRWLMREQVLAVLAELSKASA